MGVRIASTGAYLPEHRVTNAELCRSVDTSDEWIVSHTGISARHLVADGEATSHMACRAAVIALERAGIRAADLGVIIVATSTPDYSGMPSTACLVQDRLGAVNAGAFDMAAACSGFIYALEVGRGLVLTSGMPALVIGTDAMSRVVDWQDRNTCVLFGDGAGATVLMPAEGQEGIIDSYLRADGSGARALYIEGGSRRHKDTWSGADCTLKMKGRPVFNFAVRALVDVVEYFERTAGISQSDIDAIIPHQGNFRIIQSAAKRLAIPEDRFYLNIADVANTSAGSVPIALNEMVEKELLKTGDLVVMVGFGAGLTYGGNLVRWG